ncbi:MAG: slr1658 superfamily regulator [Prochlorotrichaceae cyanobacterium]
MIQDHNEPASPQSRGNLISTILVLTPVMAGLVILGSVLGLFRALEWAAQDQFFILKAEEPKDDRITIVTIDESDIQYVGRWPMPDGIFAQAIRNIKAQNPVAIGIDIYRDLPVEPGHQELEEVFSTTPNLIGIQKVVGNPINPPPILSENNQVAANDLVLDPDGKARRGLVLLSTDSDENLLEGFGVRMGLSYLEEQGVEFQEGEISWAHQLRQRIDQFKDNRTAPGSLGHKFFSTIAWLLPDPRWIYQLEQARLIPLSDRDGDYNADDMGGYQILLSYRNSSIEKSFQSISLESVLKNEIPANFFSDRLVFMGSKAPSLNDNFPTPYNSTLQGSAADLMPGVALHATVASQIISASLDGRPLLRTSPKLLNWLLILIWSGYSVSIGTLCVRQKWVLRGIASLILASGIIIGVGYIAFQSGWLVPIFTPLVAVTLAGITSMGSALWGNLKLSYKQLEEYAQTLEDKVRERTAELESANEEISLLNDKLTDENQRMSAELGVAREMQQMILPKKEELETIEGLDISGFMEPADEVGGDYYDVFSKDGIVTLSIGDVTGHGLESGILMIMTQTAVRALKETQEVDPVRCLDALNRTLYKNVERMQSDKSLTLVILNYDGQRVSISGQHEETLLVAVDGTVQRIDTMDLGFPIGLEEEIADFVNQQSHVLRPGEGIVLYTDGVTEAENLEGEQYELDRLCAVITQNWQNSATTIKEAIIDDIRAHIGTQKVFDDITLLVVKRKPDPDFEAKLASSELAAADPETEEADDREANVPSPELGTALGVDFCETFGAFREDFSAVEEEEFLEIGFSPTSNPIQDRWRNHGLSADFAAEYLATFIPISDETPQNEARQVALKSSVSYIANELLENAMKFNDHRAYSVQFGLRLFMEDDLLRVILTASNSLTPDLATQFKAFIREFLAVDPQDFYITQMEASAEDESGTVSGLGLVTMVNDHEATLGWKFETVAGNLPQSLIPIVTTMVQISV